MPYQMSTDFHRPKRILLCLIFVLLLGCVQHVNAHGTQDISIISPADLAVDKNAFHILDVRSTSDYSQGHIPGAHSLPLDTLSIDMLTHLQVDRSRTVVVYGNTEFSAQKAKSILKELGFEYVRVLEGGLSHYSDDGFFIKRGIPGGSDRSQGNEGIIITPGSHDFGKISGEDGIVSTDFSVYNRGAGKVEIEQISSSCGCTSAIIKTGVIEAGESTDLSVYFDPNFHREPEGKFTRSVFIDTVNGAEIEVRVQVEISR